MLPTWLYELEIKETTDNENLFPQIKSECFSTELGYTNRKKMWVLCFVAYGSTKKESVTRAKFIQARTRNAENCPRTNDR